MYTQFLLAFDKVGKMFKMRLARQGVKSVESKTHSVITQIGGINNVQNVKAGGKVTITGNQNNVQNVQAGDDIVIVATQIGGKGNVQRIE